jgi:chondroitin 4-sulfotransferase 11
MHGNLETIGIEKYLIQTKNYKTLFGNGLQHLTAKQIKFRLGNDIFNNYFKFSVIRNPYERLVSYVAWQSGKWENKTFLTREEFIEFIKRNFSFMNLVFNKLPYPQHSYLSINHKLIVDYLIRFETLHKDFNSFVEMRSLNFELDIRMSSNHMEYSYYYDKKSLKLVGNYYKKDFSLFGY